MLSIPIVERKPYKQESSNKLYQVHTTNHSSIEYIDHGSTLTLSGSQCAEEWDVVELM